MDSRWSRLATLVLSAVVLNVWHLLAVLFCQEILGRVLAYDYIFLGPFHVKVGRILSILDIRLLLTCVITLTAVKIHGPNLV